MKKIFSLLILVMASIGVVTAQPPANLSITGSAVPGGTAELTARPNGTFFYAGALTPGDFKFTDNTNYLVPSPGTPTLESILCDKSEWTATSVTSVFAGAAANIINGNYDTSNGGGDYWYSNAAPAEIVIDMKAPVEVSRIETWRGVLGAIKLANNIKYYISSDNSTWTLIASGNTWSDDKNTLDVTPVTGQYLKLVVLDTEYPTVCGISEIDVYKAGTTPIYPSFPKEKVILSKAGWTATSVTSVFAGSAANIIRGDYDTSNEGGDYWYSNAAPASIVIDMQTPKEVSRIETWRGVLGTIKLAKNIEYYISNDPDPSASTWTLIASGNTWSSDKNTLDVAVPITGQYLKLVVLDTDYPTVCGISEIDVYELGDGEIIPSFLNEETLLDKSGWTVEASSSVAPAYPKEAVIDNNYDNANNFWHSNWTTDIWIPQWLIIDMQIPVEISRIDALRRDLETTITIDYFIGDDPDPDATSWKPIGTGGPSWTNDWNRLDLTNPVSGRYLKLYMPPHPDNGNCSLTEIDVYSHTQGLFKSTEDDSAPGWTVADAGDYKINVDISSETANGGIYTLPVENLYMFGGCTCAGWDPTIGMPFTPGVDPYTFVFDGQLKIYDDNLFYILGQQDFDPYSLHPYTADAPITGSGYVLENIGDNKWSIDIDQQGRYIIEVDLFHETINAQFIGLAEGANVSGIPTVREKTAVSITVNAVTNSSGNGQTVEYAISTTGDATPESGWQTTTDFTGLTATTDYYVYARTAANNLYQAGLAQRSDVITTLAPVITVVAEGLTNLQVGVALSGAKITYTLENTEYASIVNATDFVLELPTWITAGAAERTTATQIEIALSGTPTAASTAVEVVILSIAAANVTGAISAITPEGSITIGAVTGSIGIHQVNDDPVIQTLYYTLQGIMVQQPAKDGIYIVRKIYQSQKVEVSKVLYHK
jgi:hypothetical protein